MAQEFCGRRMENIARSEVVLRHMGDSHADVVARDSRVDESQSSVRRLAFVDVQDTS